VTTASLHVTAHGSTQLHPTTAHGSTVASHLACRRCRRRLHIGRVKGEEKAEEQEASAHQGARALIK